MSNTLKAARLDFFLVRQYIKSQILVLLYPLVFVLVNKSLLNGICFGMCFISMTSSYPFTVSERNGVNRLYGILPVSKKHMVLGRYLYSCAIGLLSLIFYLLVYPLVLRGLGTAVSALDVFVNAVTGLILFTLFTVFLLPGFYKFGSVKGRLFIFVPAVGYIAILAFVSFGGFDGGPALAAIDGNPLVFTAGVAVFCVVAFALSILVSIRIFEKKEQNDD